MGIRKSLIDLMLDLTSNVLALHLVENSLNHVSPDCVQEGTETCIICWKLRQVYRMIGISYKKDIILLFLSVIVND